MSKIKWVCGMSLALVFATGACSDSDEEPVGSAGGNTGGRAGATGAVNASGSSGTSASAGTTSEAGTSNESGAGGSLGTAGVEGAGSPEDGMELIGGCLPDGTALEVTTSSDSSAYVIKGLPDEPSGGEGDHNPNFKLCRSYTYTFAIDATGHPFYFKLKNSLGAADAYDTGVTNNGATKATITWTLAGTTPGVLYYQCSVHQAMGGTIDVVEPAGNARR